MDYLDNLQNIRQNLKKSEEVKFYDSVEHEEADTIAHGLMDMKESFQKIQEIIPKLTEENLSGEEVDNLIFEIGEELNHISYHINDSKLFSSKIRPDQ